MVDLPGLVFTISALLLLTRHKLTLDGRPAGAGWHFPLCRAGERDWVIKSLIEAADRGAQAPTSSGWRARADPRHPPVLLAAGPFGANRFARRAKLLALPAWLGQHWQAEVNYAFPPGHSIAAMSLAQFFGLIWLARAPAGAWLLPLWAIGIGLSHPYRHALAPGCAGKRPVWQPHCPPWPPAGGCATSTSNKNGRLGAPFLSLYAAHLLLPALGMPLSRQSAWRHRP